MNFKTALHTLSLVAGIAALSSLGCMAESGDGAEPLAAGDILEGQGVQLQGIQLQGPVLPFRGMGYDQRNTHRR